MDLIPIYTKMKTIAVKNVKRKDSVDSKPKDHNSIYKQSLKKDSILKDAVKNGSYSVKPERR